MEGTRRIVLLRPLPTGERSALGEPVEARHREAFPVWAIRESSSSGRGGDEGVVAAHVLGGEWQRAYVVRRESVPRGVDETWGVMDEDGVELNVISVDEDGSGVRARRLRITCVRTSSERVAA